MPLNEILYQTLQERFGDVRITNEGERRVADYAPDPNVPGRLRTTVRQRGEQYGISCPFCGDTRGRCYVSYAYGQRDPRTGSSNHHLWYCHNNQCQRDPGNRARLEAMLTPTLAGQAQARRRRVAAAPPQTNATPTPQAIIAPEGLTPVDQLPTDHPATEYLVGRGFDLNEVCAVWGVCMVHSCKNTRPNAEGRLAFPIFRPEPLFAKTTDTALAGWQARIVPSIGPAVAPDAKYLSATGMQKSFVLYGLPQARQTTGPVVIVEGPTDAWRYGPGAVALLGKDLSTTQRALLLHHFAGRPLVVMLDADAHGAAAKIQRDLQAARGADNRVVVAQLPAGSDPADLSREEVQAAAVAVLQSVSFQPPVRENCHDY